MLQEEEGKKKRERVQKKVQQHCVEQSQPVEQRPVMCTEDVQWNLPFSTTERTEKSFSVTVSSVFSTMN